MAKYALLRKVEESTAGGDKPSRSPVYCAEKFANTAKKPDSELTLFKFFMNSVEKFPENKCLGARTVDGNGAAGEYEFWSYRTTVSKVTQVASALKAKGIVAGSKVGVFGTNSREWMLVLQACNRMNYACVPIYDSLGENAIQYIVNHSESTIVFVQSTKLEKLEKAMEQIKALVKNVVYWGPPKEESIKKIEACGVSVHSLEDFMELGAAHEAPAEPPAPDDVCTIMYTSGTTGDPKGVVLTHRAVATGVCSLDAYRNTYNAHGPDDVYISYLPLAHIFDRMGEEMILSTGACIGYWRGDITALVEDIGCLKPTIFIGVPRVFDRIYAAVMHQVNTSSFIRKHLFKYAFNRKSFYLQSGYAQDKASPLFDKVVFSKVKGRLGGNVKLIITGGAPIAPHTEEFMKVCFCAPVVQGYGLTETCAGTFITIPDDPSMDGTVGPPLPFVEFCLESVPEMNYAADIETPIGEVLVRTVASFNGYHKSQSQTEEVLEKDGWFHTGDVGTITKEGSLKLVDRKKNIFKLSQGEYIAVEKVEAVYKESAVTEQIWVYGDSFKNFLVAVVVPAKNYVKAWATQEKKDFEYEANCKDPELKTIIQKEMDSKAQERKLKGFEIVKKVCLESEEFSVENDLLTPTFKLKRPQLLKKYQPAIDELYATT